MFCLSFETPSVVVVEMVQQFRELTTLSEVWSAELSILNAFNSKGSDAHFSVPLNTHTGRDTDKHKQQTNTQIKKNQVCRPKIDLILYSVIVINSLNYNENRTKLRPNHCSQAKNSKHPI